MESTSWYRHRIPNRSAAERRHPLSRRAHALVLVFACLFVLAGLLASTPRPASAYLAVIRQGEESRGAPESGDTFGASVAVGDFNGDGYDDLATGAPFEDASGYNHAGMVVVSYGSQYGIKRSGAQALLQSDGDALEDGALFGEAVAAGDFDNDGYDDLAIGAPLTDADETHTNVGYVFVYAGGPGGLSYWHYLWQPGGGGSLESNDRFGASLCVGNFNGLPGSNQDLAVGSPGEDWGRGNRLLVHRGHARTAQRNARLVQAVDPRRNERRGRSVRLQPGRRSDPGRRLRGSDHRNPLQGSQRHR